MFWVRCLATHARTTFRRNMNTRQHTVFLSDILKRLRSGSILPAGFQRPYVWSRADVLALFESILRGYPVGSILTWTPRDPPDLARAGRPRLGPIVTPTENRHPTLLLDGQNRLASLAWMCTYPLEVDLGLLTDHERAVWGNGDRLVVDCELRQILFVPEADAETGLRLPAAALTSSLLANPLIRAKWAGPWAHYPSEYLDSAMSWFDTAASAFLDAQVVVTELERATPQEARDAFLHICRVGVPMTESDFEAAIAWAE